MRRLVVVLLVIVATISSLCLSSQAAIAQFGATVDIVPELCTVEPRTPESLLKFLPDEKSVPLDLNGAKPVPSGEEADAETVESVTAFVYEYTACHLINHMMANFAMETERFLAANLAVLEFSEERLKQMYTDGAYGDLGYTSVVTVHEIVPLKDKRVAVHFTEVMSKGGVDHEFERVYVVESHDDIWLLDDSTLRLG